MTTPADILAVQRAHATGGRDAALTEIRRRWPDISDTVLSATLERILAASAASVGQRVRFDTPGDQTKGDRAGARSYRKRP